MGRRKMDRDELCAERLSADAELRMFGGFNDLIG